MRNVFTDKEVAVARFRECLGCDRLFRPTYSCKECGCFMKLKVKFDASTCPLGKW